MKKRILTASELTEVIDALEDMAQKNREKSDVSVDGLAKMLIVAICDEMTAIWQYLVARHSICGSGRLDLIDEYDEHLEDEWEHVKLISERLEQLGGRPVFDLDEINEHAHSWTRIESTDPIEQARIIYGAEESAKEYCRDVIRYARALGDDVTVALFKQILKDETDHSFEIAKILEGLVS